jgi:hypothetical protein
MSEKQPTVNQVLARLRRAATSGKDGLTAAQLNTTSARLRNKTFREAGVHEVGHRQTGKAGRPAVVFAHQESELVRSGELSKQPGDTEVPS